MTISLQDLEQRIYRVEQAIERGLNVSLAQFDPNPAVANAALNPPPEPAPDPAVLAKALADKTAHDDAAAAAVAAVAAAPDADDKDAHVAAAQADLETALKQFPDSPALLAAKAELDALAAEDETGEGDVVPPAETAPANASA